MADRIEIAPRRYMLLRFADGTVKYRGVSDDGYGTVLAENENVIAIKWHGGKHWVGRGIPPAYHSPSTDVLRKDADGKLTLLISWDNRRKPAAKRDAVLRS